MKPRIARESSFIQHGHRAEVNALKREVLDKSFQCLLKPKANGPTGSPHLSSLSKCKYMYMYKAALAVKSRANDRK